MFYRGTVQDSILVEKFLPLSPHHQHHQHHRSAAVAMAAHFLLSRTSTNKELLFLTSFLLPKLSLPALFSTLCRRSKHLQFGPTIHLPPAAKKVPFTATAHGFTWQDPYHWMSDVNDPDFVSYINQENIYAQAFMRDTEEMQRTLYSEMVSRMPSKITTPPERWGHWFVISHNFVLLLSYTNAFSVCELTLR